MSVRPDPDLVRPVVRALELAGYWGLVEMEFLQGRDGAMLIDVNPRFYGCMALPLACGVNLPAAWHAVALDREPPWPLPYRTGVVYRWRLADVLAAVRGSPERLRKRVHGPQAGAMWATDDPLPAPLMVGAELGTRVSRRLPGRFGASTPGRRRFRPKR